MVVMTQAIVTHLLSELVDHVEETNFLYQKNFAPGLGTHPIPFFGNPLTAKVITIGVNPSATEFKPERKWPEDITIAELQERLVHYFNLKKPEVSPHKWFEKWEKCLNTLDCSYRANAAHLDLCPRATISMGKVPDDNLFLEMLKADARWFWKFLECCKSVRLLLIAGSVTKKHYIYEFVRKVIPQEYQFIGNFKRLTGCKNSGWTRTFLLKMPKKNIFVFFISVSPSAQNPDRMIDHIEKNKDDLRNWLWPTPS